MDRATRRRHGRFYTTSALAAEVARRALGPLAGRSGLRILDPACGQGVFLAEARRLAGKGTVLVGVDEDREALERARAALGPEVDLRAGDALALDWGQERFDVVLGNPPWVSYSGRHAQRLGEARRRRLASFETFRRWPSLHGPFVELAVHLARARIGLILPAQVCDLGGYGPVRALLRRRCRIESCTDLGEGAFEGVSQPCCALVAERTAGGSAGGDAPFALDGAAPDSSGDSPRVPAATFADIGVHTGNCAGRLLCPGGAPIREGRDVHAYRLDEPRKTLRADYAAGPGEYFRVHPLERYRQVPIVLRQTASRPVAALHTPPTYFRNSVLACRGIPGVAPELVVAWLNSSAVGDFHRRTVREAGQRAFPQLKIRHLRALPVPRWEEAPRGLVELAVAVAREGRLDLAVELDRGLARLMPRRRRPSG